jgi:acetyl-CoA C-acetyltransferase
VRIAIANAKRTFHGSFQGALASYSAVELCTQTVKALDVQNVESVYIGSVLSAGLGQGPARQVSMNANLNVPATLINKVCGSGMKAIAMACQDIMLGRYSSVVAGGMENMSKCPYLLNRSGYRFGHAKILDHLLYDGLEDAYSHLSMGMLAEKVAHHYAFSREDQERYVMETYERAQVANFDRECVLIDSLNKDETLSHVKTEKFPKLKPAFGGTITAATSSSLADGASSLWLRKNFDHPLAWIVGYSEYANNPDLFISAPVGAIKKLCESLGWSIDEVDAFEINEAFAIAPMIAMKDLSIPRSKINLKGGACVLGHPLGSSGARIVCTLAHIMTERNLKKGIASLCIGGGEAMAIALLRD